MSSLIPRPVKTDRPPFESRPTPASHVSSLGKTIWGSTTMRTIERSPFDQPYRLPETIDLRLHKASHVRVRTIDPADRPVAGVLVSPQSVRLSGKMSYVPIARFPSVSQTSDADGMCDFAWLPADAAEPISFHASIAPVQLSAAEP